MCINKKSCTCSCKTPLQESKKSKIIKESISLEQKELLKQHKIIQESLLSIYNICSEKGIYNKKLFDLLEESYKNTDNSILLLLTENFKTK